MTFISQHKGAVLWSLVLHVAVLAVLLTGIALPERPRAPVAAPLIEGTLVDTATLERQQKVREDAARQERQRQQRVERERRAAEEQQRLTQQREEQRVAAEQQRVREEAAQKERDRVAAEKAEQARKEQQAREQRERQAQAEAAAKAERERAATAAAQKRREDELARATALEAEANAARQSGLYDQYVFAIQQRIRSKWQRPLSARAGIDCVVTVTQLQTGVVVSAKVASCNGDDAVRASIERAVMAASPLPTAPSPGLYERIVNVRFKPEE